LDVRPARRARVRETHLREHLVRLEGRLVEAAEELGGRDRPLAVRAARDKLGVERERDRRQVRRGVAVCERAAERPAVTYLAVTDESCGVREDRAVLLHERVVRE